MDDVRTTERCETVIIGGGQAGLATGYHLARRDRPFVILDANRRVGDAWRNRWDSLHLFTPARYNGLPGWRSPGPPGATPARTRSPTTCRRTPHGSLFRSASDSPWTACPPRAAGTS